MATVYKILSPDLTECYVGSTTTTMEVRRRSHLSKCNKTASRILFERYGEESCKFVVLEVCPLEERRIKEQWWLEHSVGAVNTYRAFVSEQARYEEDRAQKKKDYHVNREEKDAYQKAYREANREDKLAYNKAYYEATRDAILAQKKAYYQAKKSKIPAEPSAAQ